MKPFAFWIHTHRNFIFSELVLMLNSCSKLIHIIHYTEAGKHCFKRNHRILDLESTSEIVEFNTPFVPKITKAQGDRLWTHPDSQIPIQKGVNIKFWHLKTRPKQTDISKNVHISWGGLFIFEGHSKTLPTMEVSTVEYHGI